MADPFVPVHLAINWFTVNSSSLNRGASPLTVDEACRRPRGEQSVRPRNTEEEETPISATLLGYEILKEREKLTDEDEIQYIEYLLNSHPEPHSILGDVGRGKALATQLLTDSEVYKILIKRPEGDSWLVFRRYTDFCILSDQVGVIHTPTAQLTSYEGHDLTGREARSNTKEEVEFLYRELFPGFHQALPPKRRFKDNYDGSFLEKRRLGLQTFLENLMLHKDISMSEPVRYFLSVDDPLSPFYSTEESRAFCETLEQKNHRLLRELLEKQREVDSLTKSLEDKENYIDLLWRKGRALNVPD